MSDRKTPLSAEDLDDAALNEARGGMIQCWPSTWKLSSNLDGKSDEAADITPDQKTIIGGFKPVSGLD